METLYKPIYTFSKDVPEYKKAVAKSMFMHARQLAVEQLNPRYEKWNKQYGSYHKNEVIDENDKLKDYGGTNYCMFIQEKSRKVVGKINKNTRMFGWELDIDEIGDIIFRNKRDRDLTMTLEFMPVEN